MIARVAPDVAGIAKTFDYLVPPAMAADVRVGTMVRVVLAGRRVGGWVVAVSDVADAAALRSGRPLQPLAKVTGWGPPADLVDLAGWAAWRWAGRRTAFLRTASPPTAVRGLPASTGGPEWRAGPAGQSPAGQSPAGHRLTVIRTPPADDLLPMALEAAAQPDALVLAPSLTAAGVLAARLRRAGVRVAEVPRDWALAAAGGCVAVGARAGAWAPRPRLGTVLVLDEGDEAYQEERAPTWNARDVAVERARRAGVPCVLTSPHPSLVALAQPGVDLQVPSRAEERAGWPIVEVVDRRHEPPGSGLYSSRLVDLVRTAGPDRRVVCVLNRKGRAPLLACVACGELARCEVCDGPVADGGGRSGVEGALGCRRCGATRPTVCTACGATRMKALRVGVTRARDELELLAGRPVAEVTADDGGGQVPDASVLVGTEAVLHRVAGAHAVAFLDFDHELLAPRYSAGEHALALLGRAARLVGGRGAGGRGAGGRLLVQTRLPGHEVIDAVVHADPSRFAVVESARRAALRLPPETALAVVSGEAAAAFVEAVDHSAVEVLGPSDGRWLVRAPDHRTLAEALAAVPRPPGRLRVEVDPRRM